MEQDKLIYIATCTDTEPVIFCITSDLDDAVEAVKQQAFKDDVWDTIHEALECRDYYIDVVKDGERFWWRGDMGSIGDTLLSTDELKKLIPDGPTEA